MKNSTGIGNKRFQEEQLQNHRRIIYLFIYEKKYQWKKYKINGII